MTKKLTGRLLAVCFMVAGATGASAADVAYPEPVYSGYYFALSGGLNRVFDLDYDTTDAGPLDLSGEFEFDYGFRGAAAVGKRFGGNLRAELEFAFSSTDADDVETDAVSSTDADGSLDIFSVLAKLDYEMEIFSWWHPYLGVGAGFAHVTVDGLGASGADAADGSDTVFAAAIEGGSKFALSENVELFTQTQLMFLCDVETGFVSDADSITFENPMVLSSSVGLRIGF